MGLQLNVTAAVNGVYTASAAVGSVADTIALKQAVSYITGSGAGQADTLYTETISLAASASETRNLTSLTDPLGASIDFARIKAIVVIAAPGNTNDIVLGDAASDAFVGPLGATGTVNTRPGGMTVMAATDATGWVVTASTAMNLKVANSGSGSSVTGTLVIIGAAE